MHHKLAAGLVLAVTGLVSGCQRSQTIDARASDAGAAKDAVAPLDASTQIGGSVTSVGTTRIDPNGCSGANACADSASSSRT